MSVDNDELMAMLEVIESPAACGGCRRVMLVGDMYMLPAPRGARVRFVLACARCEGRLRETLG